MPNAGSIVAAKGGRVISIAPGATVIDAARVMNDHHIGSLVVLEDKQLVGIFTERDVLRRVVAEQRDPSATLIQDVMTSPVACATPRTSRDELRSVMREKRIRHIPVIDDARVVGMVSIGDLNRVENEVQEQTILYLEQFMSVM